MDEELIQRLEASFDAVKPQGEALVENFYASLFSNHPEVRPMFPDEMQDQKKKLFQALAFVVANLRKPGALTEKLHELGAGHAKFGTTAEHYPIVRDELVGAMGTIAGDLWSEQLQDDWMAAINAVAGIMLDGASAAS